MRSSNGLHMSWHSQLISIINGWTKLLPHRRRKVVGMSTAERFLFLHHQLLMNLERMALMKTTRMRINRIYSPFCLFHLTYCITSSNCVYNRTKAPLIWWWYSLYAVCYSSFRIGLHGLHWILKLNLFGSRRASSLEYKTNSHLHNTHARFRSNRFPRVERKRPSGSLQSYFSNEISANWYGVKAPQEKKK